MNGYNRSITSTIDEALMNGSCFKLFWSWANLQESPRFDGASPWFPEASPSTPFDCLGSEAAIQHHDDMTFAWHMT